MQQVLNVLIVEDEPILAELLADLVEESGHKVCGKADNEESVLLALEALRPDLVFMDLVLKDGSSGLELTRHITKEADIPVIIVSGAEGEDVLQGVSNSGAFSFIPKPISAINLKMNLLLATRHHNLKKNLEESEKRYRKIFSNAPIGIYISSPDGYYTTCNQAFADMLGYSSPEDLLQNLHSQDEQLYDAPERRKELIRLLLYGPVFDFSSKVYGKDGEMIWISEYCTPSYDPQGHLTHYEGVVVDITEKKMAEDAFQTAYSLINTTINSLLEAVMVTDLEGRLITANNEARRLAEGRVKEGERVPFLDKDDEANVLHRFLQNYAPTEGALVMPDSTRLHYTIAPYRNAENMVIGAVLVSRQWCGINRPD